MKKITDYTFVVKNGKVMVSVCIDNKWEYVTEKEFLEMQEVTDHEINNL